MEFRHHLGELSAAEFQEAKKPQGYYHAVASKAWNRSVEAANFYVALKRAGLPAILCDARAILARFKVGGPYRFGSSRYHPRVPQEHVSKAFGNYSRLHARIR